MNIMALLKDWVIPLFSFVLSVWFAASAKKDTERAKGILDQLDKAMKGWQNEIMTAAVGLLNSNPQIIAGKTALSQSHALEAAIDTLQAQLKDTGRLSSYEYNEIIKQLGILGSVSRQSSRAERLDETE